MTGRDQVRAIRADQRLDLRVARKPGHLCRLALGRVGSICASIASAARMYSPTQPVVRQDADRCGSTRSTRAQPAPATPQATSPAPAACVKHVCLSMWQVNRGKPGTPPRPVDHLIQPGGRQRHPAPRALQHHEARIGHHLGRALGLQVLAERLEEPARDRHDPLPAALPRRDEQPPLARVDVPQAATPAPRSAAAPPAASPARSPDPAACAARPAARRPRPARAPSATSSAGAPAAPLHARVAPHADQPDHAAPDCDQRPRRHERSDTRTSPAMLDSRRAIVLADSPPRRPRSAPPSRAAVCAAEPGTRTRQPRPPPPAPCRPPRRTPSSHTPSPATCSPRHGRRRTPDTHPPADAPSVIDRNSDPSITRCMLGTKLTAMLLPQDDRTERNDPPPAGRRARGRRSAPVASGDLRSAPTASPKPRAKPLSTWSTARIPGGAAISPAYPTCRPRDHRTYLQGIDHTEIIDAVRSRRHRPSRPPPDSRCSRAVRRPPQPGGRSG